MVLRQENAIRLIVAAANPAPQLMKLRQPETLRVFNHHYARIRDIDPYLNNGGSDQYVDFPCEEITHRVLFFVPEHLPMKQPESQIREYVLTQKFEMFDR